MLKCPNKQTNGKKCNGDLKSGDTLRYTDYGYKKIGEHLFCDTCEYEKDITWDKRDEI